MLCYQKGTSGTNSNNSTHSENTQKNDSGEWVKKIQEQFTKDTRTLGMSSSSYEKCM